MRKLFLMFFVATISIASFAQENTSTSSPIEVCAERKRLIREELMQTRHQIRLGVGVIPQFGCCGYSTSNRISTPTMSVEYSYRVVDFLEVGASIAFTYRSHNTTYTKYEYDDGSSRGFDGYSFTRSYLLSWSVFARYAWFNRRWVSLYSSLGIMGGYSNMYEKMDGQTIDSYSGFGSINNVPVIPELVPIGIRVGRRFFGYFEPFGISARGFVLMAGFGYKF